MQKLKDTVVKNAKAGEKRIKLTDGGGLYLHITPAKSKSWRYQYLFHGKAKIMTFGLYPEVSLAKARKLHEAARELWAAGIDPNGKTERAEERGRTYSHNVSRCLRSLVQTLVRRQGKRHVESTKRRMEANVLPVIGKRPIAEIKSNEIVSMLEGIQACGVKDIAKRAFNSTDQVFRFGITRKLCTTTPPGDFRPRDVLKSKPEVNHARIDVKELPARLKKMEVYEGGLVTRHALWLLAYTFVRTSELISGMATTGAATPDHYATGSRCALGQQCGGPSSRQAQDASRKTDSGLSTMPTFKSCWSSDGHRSAFTFPHPLRHPRSPRP